ncbi:hypothetical protein RMO59_23830 [Streptomyces alfalfae]
MTSNAVWTAASISTICPAERVQASRRPEAGSVIDPALERGVTWDLRCHQEEHGPFSDEELAKARAKIFGSAETSKGADAV